MMGREGGVCQMRSLRTGNEVGSMLFSATNRACPDLKAAEKPESLWPSHSCQKRKDC